MLTLVLILTASVGHLAAADADSTAAIGALPPLSPLDDAVTRLIPERDRSEAEEDRVRATAFFAHGRILFQRQKFDQALRQFQRAWRNDPQSVSILDDVLKVAGGLRRPDEFYRYAVIKAELDPVDAQLLRRLAAYLAQETEFDRAIGLLNKSLEVGKETEDDGDRVAVWLELGRLHVNNGDLAKAAEPFEKVRQALDNPQAHGLDKKRKDKLLKDAAGIYFLFGESFLAANRLDDAMEMFERANKAKPDPSTFALQKARVEAKRDHVDEALVQFNKYFDSGSDRGGLEPYELFAELLAKKTKDENAAKAQLRERLNPLYETKPTSVLGYFLASTALENEEFDRAEELYSALLKEKATLDAYAGLIEIHRHRNDVPKLLSALGETYLKTGQFESVGESVTKVSQDAELLTQLITAARKQFADDDAQPGTAMAVALLCVAAKRFDEADEFFELALQQKEPAKPQVLLTWGLDMSMADEYGRAAKALRRAIDEGLVEKDQFQFHYFLAGALEMEGHTDEALAVAKEAVARSKNKPFVRGRVPWILYHAKRYDEAEKAYQALLKDLDGDHSAGEIREAVRSARLTLSNICVLSDRMPEAEEWLEQVLDEFPEYTGAMNDLGYLWADQNKRLGRALNMTRQAVRDEPDNKAYRDSLGWALFRQGQFDQALKELEAAADDEEPDGVILDHLGDALLKAGNREQAIATWRRAVEAFKKQEDDKLLERTELKLKKHTSE